MSKERKYKHTPGPWKVKDNLLSGHSIIATRRRLIAEVNDYILNSGKIDSEEMRKNAKLIAKAPEMAEEIQQLKSQLEQHKDKIAQLCKVVDKKTKVIDKQHKRIGELEEESRRLNEKK
jgi:uncharacterized coiled-coil DUF342 family protein